MKRNVSDNVAVFFSHPGRKGIGRRKELLQIGWQVLGVPVNSMDHFSYSDTSC